MTTLGVSAASYHASTSIQRSERLSAASVEKISRARESIADGDRAAFAAMDNTLNLDVAGTGAALKSMVVAQGYLTTALTSLDNATDILTRMQELAVMGANGANSTQSNIDIDMEAEALADAFHHALSTANYKGKKIFNQDDNVLNLSYGGRGATGSITQTAFDYDELYDYKNPTTTSLLAGVGYIISRDLSDAEKQTILARTDGITADDLVSGFQFTTQPPVTENIGPGSINILDDVGDGNLRNYVKNAAPVLIDEFASVEVAGDFNGGYLDFAITENIETSDVLSIADDRSDVLRVDADGVIEFRSSAYNNRWIEIGQIDEDRNGVGGALGVKLFADATIPGTSNITNGDFSQTMQEVVRYNKNMITVDRTEERAGVISSFNSGNDAIAAPNTPTVGDYTNVSPTTEGAGSGLRVTLQIGDDGTGAPIISGIDILDGGQGYVAGDVLAFDTGNGVVQFSVGATQGTEEAKVEVTLTRASTTTNSSNTTWTAQTMATTSYEVSNGVGYYDFDATGRPLSEGGGPALTFQVGDVEQRSIRRERQVANPDGVITDDRGNPTNNVTEVYFQIGNVTTTTGSTYNGETTLTESVWDGANYNAVAETVPLNWTRFEDRVDFGTSFTISEFANGVNDEVVTNADGDRSVDTSARVEFVVPTPTDVEMAETENGPGNDDTRISSGSLGGSVGVQNGALSLAQNNFEMANGYGVVHGPAAVSDKFSAEAGDFLKFDYTAVAGGDHYHVAGYIYEVDNNGDAVGDPVIALNETGETGGGRASVEVPTTGEYRFVFVNGTYDGTGGQYAGASMTIDNIVAEDPYSIEKDAIEALVQAIAFKKSAGAATSTPTKKMTVELDNQNENNPSVLLNDTYIQVDGFDATVETDGPYMPIPTYDLVHRPSDAVSAGSNLLTSKIETVHEKLRTARIEASASYIALEAAIANVTDLRSQYSLGRNTISDLNFSRETAYLSKRQIQNDVATAILAQANKAQAGILALVNNSYK